LLDSALSQPEPLIFDRALKLPPSKLGSLVLRPAQISVYFRPQNLDMSYKSLFFRIVKRSFALPALVDRDPKIPPSLKKFIGKLYSLPLIFTN
jgi:hypothetical protein